MHGDHNISYAHPSDAVIKSRVAEMVRTQGESVKPNHESVVCKPSGLKLM